MILQGVCAVGFVLCAVGFVLCMTLEGVCSRVLYCD